MLGVELNVQIVTESFLAVPFLVGAGARGRPDPAAAGGPAGGRRRTSAILPCPFEPVPLIEAMWWHPMYTRDAGHRWLRDVFVQAGAAPDDDLAAPEPSPAEMLRTGGVLLPNSGRSWLQYANGSKCARRNQRHAG